MEVDELTSFGRLYAAQQDEERDLATPEAEHFARNRRQGSIEGDERPRDLKSNQLTKITSGSESARKEQDGTESIELQPMRILSKQRSPRQPTQQLSGEETREMYESDVASSVDADDFLRPPDMDPVEENTPQPPRPISPERLARRKERKRTLSALLKERRKSKGQGLFKKLRTRASNKAHSADGHSDSGSSSSSSRSSLSLRSAALSGVSTVSRFSTKSRSLWKFWRSGSDASSSTHSRSKDSSSEDESDFDEKNEPVYTLVVPNLEQPSASSIYSDFYTTSTEPKLAPVLTELHAFWKNRNDSEGIAGDLGGPAAERHYRMTTTLERLHKQQHASVTHPALRDVSYSGPAWWLDITSPSAQDMRLLRKSLALHPLTIEDILHQDPHEKYEIFDKLGYEFVCIRALDDKYFRYIDPAAVDGYRTNMHRSDAVSHGEKHGDYIDEKRDATDGVPQPTGSSSKNRLQRPKLKIVEGVGGKEGVEGVGVGAIEFYLVIYKDGIISVGRNVFLPQIMNQADLCL